MGKLISPALLEQARHIIERIALTRSKNGAFAYYQGTDIAQEVWTMCLDALANYKPSKGTLENFLNVHVANRLKNLRRDRYFRPNKKSKTGRTRTRINLINAISLDGREAANNSRPLGSSGYAPEPHEELAATELLAYLREGLSAECRRDLEIVLSGGKLPRDCLLLLRCEVTRLVEEYNGK